MESWLLEKKREEEEEMAERRRMDAKTDEDPKMSFKDSDRIVRAERNLSGMAMAMAMEKLVRC